MKKQMNHVSFDWQLLSAYLDGELSGKAMHQMEEKLQTDLECRQALEQLRHTRHLLRSLPVRRVPKNFTVSAQPSSQKIIPSFIGVLRYSSAAAALLLVAVFALDLAQKPRLNSLDKNVEFSQPAAAEMQAAKAPAEEEPKIIYWGAPPAVMGAYGKGGGGAEGSGLGGGGAPSGFYGVGGGEPQPEIAPEATPLAEEAPAGEVSSAEEKAVPEVAENALPPVADALPAQERLSGSGPILGISAPEDRGTTNIGAIEPLRQPSPPIEIRFKLIEIVLAALLLLTAVPAWLLKRK